MCPRCSKNMEDDTQFVHQPELLSQEQGKRRGLSRKRCSMYKDRGTNSGCFRDVRYGGGGYYKL